MSEKIRIEREKNRAINERENPDWKRKMILKVHPEYERKGRVREGKANLD